MHLPIFKQVLLTQCFMIMLCLSTSSLAALMVPVEPAKASSQPPTENRLGGTIAKIDQKGVEINGVYYRFKRYGVKIHGLDGKLTQKSTLKPGMLVSVKVLRQTQTITISEIWVIKDE